MVINADAPRQVLQLSHPDDTKGHRLWFCRGRSCPLSNELMALIKPRLEIIWREISNCFPLPGNFQVANALAALGLGVAGVPIIQPSRLSPTKSIRGRLECVTRHRMVRRSTLIMPTLQTL